MPDAYSFLPPHAVRVEEGFYKTPDGTLYIHAAELLAANGYPPTRVSQEWIARIAQENGTTESIPVMVRELQKGPPRRA